MTAEEELHELLIRRIQDQQIELDEGRHVDLPLDGVIGGSTVQEPTQILEEDDLRRLVVGTPGVTVALEGVGVETIPLTHGVVDPVLLHDEAGEISVPVVLNELGKFLQDISTTGHGDETVSIHGEPIALRHVCGVLLDAAISRHPFRGTGDGTERLGEIALRDGLDLRRGGLRFLLHSLILSIRVTPVGGQRCRRSPAADVVFDGRFRSPVLLLSRGRSRRNDHHLFGRPGVLRPWLLGLTCRQRDDHEREEGEDLETSREAHDVGQRDHVFESPCRRRGILQMLVSSTCSPVLRNLLQNLLRQVHTH